MVNTVVPQLTNVPTYDHFELQPAVVAKFCGRSFQLRTEKGRGGRREIQISNCRWWWDCFFVALSPQQLECVCWRRLGIAFFYFWVCVCLQGGFELPGKVRCYILLFKNCSGCFCRVFLSWGGYVSVLWFFLCVLMLFFQPQHVPMGLPVLLFWQFPPPSRKPHGFFKV